MIVRYSIYTARFWRLWERLTKPHDSVKDDLVRQNSHLLASLFLGIFIVIILLVPLQIIAVGENRDELVILVPNLLITASFILYAYRRSLSGDYKRASLVMIIYATIAIFVTGTAIGGDAGLISLYYLSIVLFFASFFFPPSVAVTVAIVHLAGMMLIAIFVDDITFSQLIRGPLAFNLTLSPLLLLFSRHREQIEANRRTQLAQNEARYRIVSELGSDYAFSVIVNPDETYSVEWITSDSFTRITGYAPDEMRGVGQKQYHPDDQERVASDLNKILQGKSVTAIYRITTKSGEVRWLNMIRRPVWDNEQQRVVRYYGVAQDVTERIKAEHALRESEERYRIVSELISDYAFSMTVNPDGSFTGDWWTDSFERVTGYTSNDINSLSGSPMLYHPDDTERVMADMHEVLAGKTVESEYRIITRQGDTRWIALRRLPVWDEQENRAVKFYGVAQDITDRKMTEEALRESEERYRIISELMSDYAYMYRIEPDGSITALWMTESFERVTGYNLQDVNFQGKNYTLYHPDYIEIARQDVEKTVNGEATDNEYLIYNQEGALHWLNIIRRPIWNKDQTQVSGFYGVAKDITDRKNAEAHKIRRALEHERLNLISSFVRAVSHDFRTSLTTIETNRYLIERTTPDPGEAKLQQRLSSIHDAVQRLTEQMQNLTMVSSLIDLNAQPCDLNELMRTVIIKQTPFAESKGIHIDLQEDQSMLEILADSEEMEQAIKHLLSNAIAYTPEGGEIRIHIYQQDSVVNIEVSDNGEGIDAEHIPNIFDFFYRADKARSTHSGGVGLGLSIVKLIAEAHNGSVSVQSALGEGSVFTLTLPIHINQPLPG